VNVQGQENTAQQSTKRIGKPVIHVALGCGGYKTTFEQHLERKFFLVLF
jgi:hypothetical protein